MEPKRTNSFSEKEAYNIFVTQDNIKYIFKNLKSKTSTGLNGIPNIALKMCVNNTINKFCKINNLVNDKQFGFNHKHSTINAIKKLVSDIYCNIVQELAW